MAIEQLSVLGACPSLANPPEAPVDHDRGFLVQSQTEELQRIDFTTMPIPYTFEQTLTKPTIYIKRHGDIPGESGLPPRDFWLIDPEKDKLETPTDERGLIDIDLLVSQVKATISPDYSWPPQLSMDHLYWPEEWYHQLGSDAVRFRELSTHRVIVPRVFENWKHKITIPSAPPELEVMQARCEAWSIARSLFDNMRRTELWRQRHRRRDFGVIDGTSRAKPGSADKAYASQMIMREIMKHHFKGVDMDLERLHELPQEDRFVEPDESHDIIIDRLCRLVGAQALYIVDSVAA